MKRIKEELRPDGDLRFEDIGKASNYIDDKDLVRLSRPLLASGYSIERSEHNHSFFYLTGVPYIWKPDSEPDSTIESRYSALGIPIIVPYSPERCILLPDAESTEKLLSLILSDRHSLRLDSNERGFDVRTPNTSFLVFSVRPAGNNTRFQLSDRQIRVLSDYIRSSSGLEDDDAEGIIGSRRLLESRVQSFSEWSSSLR